MKKKKQKKYALIYVSSNICRFLIVRRILWKNQEICIFARNFNFRVKKKYFFVVFFISFNISRDNSDFGIKFGDQNCKTSRNNFLTEILRQPV